MRVIRLACAIKISLSKHLLTMEKLHVHERVLSLRRLLRLWILQDALASGRTRAHWFERCSLIGARMRSVLHGVNNDIDVAAESAASLSPMLTRLFGERCSNGLLLKLGL